MHGEGEGVVAVVSQADIQRRAVGAIDQTKLNDVPLVRGDGNLVAYKLA